MVERFHVGQRVRLNTPLSAGWLPKGTTGTVTKVDDVGATAWVRIDQHFSHLDHWDNTLLVRWSEITERGLLARLRAAWRGE